MITPVESGRTCSGRMPSAAAAATQVARAFAMPVSPVPGVGHAGVHQHGPRRHARVQVLAAQQHGRRRVAITREHARGAAAFVQRQQQHVLAIRLAHVGPGDAEAHAGDAQEVFRLGRMNVHGHGGRIIGAF
jgi:hypothetical protein